MLRDQMRKRLRKKAKKGFRGYPMATIAYYGPDSATASKVAASVFLGENQEPFELRRWFSEGIDVRSDPRVLEEILAFLEQFDVKSVAMVDRTIGCPHEEGIDYEGSTCPMCPYWAGRDRWTGEPIN